MTRLSTARQPELPELNDNPDSSSPPIFFFPPSAFPPAVESSSPWIGSSALSALSPLAQRLLASALGSSTAAVAVFDECFRCAALNAALFSVCRIPPQSCFGKTLPQLLGGRPALIDRTFRFVRDSGATVRHFLSPRNIPPPGIGLPIFSPCVIPPGVFAGSAPLFAKPRRKRVSAAISTMLPAVIFQTIATPPCSTLPAPSKSRRLAIPFCIVPSISWTVPWLSAVRFQSCAWPPAFRAPVIR